MRIQQDIADKWDRNETTPTHVVHEATTCKTWDINYNTKFIEFHRVYNL